MKSAVEIKAHYSAQQTKKKDARSCTFGISQQNNKEMHYKSVTFRHVVIHSEFEVFTAADHSH